MRKGLPKLGVLAAGLVPQGHAARTHKHQVFLLAEAGTKDDSR
jgi:hypothetical protein